MSAVRKPEDVAAEIGCSPRLSHDELRSLLHYDEAAGVFTRLVGRKGGKLVAGSARKDGYVRISINGRAYLAHRLAWFFVYGTWPLGFLDHRDGNPSNNCLANLRPATQPENMANAKRRSDNKSGFKGVNWFPSVKKWGARISKNGKRQFLGYFDTAEEAGRAYAEAAGEVFGEFARPE